mmetsp:Transcript_132508/g.411976  ORF Transcript_132508/g.411976 Transcript_132508/m.411976 type:complete len:131 (-) Transcript_132508:199-591(-)
MARFVVAALLLCSAHIMVAVRDEDVQFDRMGSQNAEMQGQLREQPSVSRQRHRASPGEGEKPRRAGRAEECVSAGAERLWDEFRSLSAKHKGMSDTEALELEGMFDKDVVVSFEASTTRQVKGSDEGEGR